MGTGDDNVNNLACAVDRTRLGGNTLAASLGKAPEDQRPSPLLGYQ